MVFVVPLGEGLAVGADNMVFCGKILEVCKMLVGQALEHLRLHGVVLEKALRAPLAAVYTTALMAAASRIPSRMRVLSR